MSKAAMPFAAALRHARAPLAVFAAMGIGWGCFAAVLPDLQTMLGIDERQLGALIFMTPVAAVAAMLAAPAIGAALGRVALPVAAVGMALSFALPGQTGTLWLFALAMMCCGAGTGLADVLMNARVSSLETARGVHLMTLCHAAYSFGYAGSATVTGLLRDALWPPGQVMGAAALAAVALALISIERDGTIEGLARPKGKASGRLGPVPLIGGGIVLIAFMTENAAENWSALFIEKTLGGSPTDGALGPATIALTMGITRLLGQGLVQRLGALWLLCGGALVSATGALIAAMAASPGMAYTGFIVMGIGSSMIAPTAFSLTGALAAPETRARAVARATLLGYFGYFFGPPAVGLIAGTYGLRGAFVFAAAMLAAVLVLAPVMARLRKSAALPD